MNATPTELLRAAARHDALPFRVSGGCMEPLVRHGAHVRVRAVDTYRPGDILAFRTESGDTRLHRLLGRIRFQGDWHFLTSGDRQGSPDRPVPPGAVIGRLEGGDCSPRAVRVPVRDRLRARLRYPVVLAQWARRKLQSQWSRVPPSR